MPSKEVGVEKLFTSVVHGGGSEDSTSALGVEGVETSGLVGGAPCSGSAP